MTSLKIILKIIVLLHSTVEEIFTGLVTGEMCEIVTTFSGIPSPPLLVVAASFHLTVMCCVVRQNLPQNMVAGRISNISHLTIKDAQSSYSSSKCAI